MMQKARLILTAIALVTITIAYGQRKVALHSNGGTTIFGGASPFTDAYNASQPGDTIYLPGGTLTSPSSFNKPLTIIGTGFFADSSEVTGVTEIASFTLYSGADRFHLEGVTVNGNIVFDSNTKIDSVVIKRCKITGYINILGTSNTCEGIIIEENVVMHSINGQNTTGLVISNNLGRFISSVNNGHIRNNILINSVNITTRILTAITESYIENNYIANTYMAGNVINNCINNTFEKNAFHWDPTADGYNTWTNNYVNVNPATFFVNYIWPFTEEGNYNLDNPAEYQGTTGNEIGIYGGYNPAKEGYLPSNPHFQSKNIAPQTTTGGELSIQIQVEAQNE